MQVWQVLIALLATNTAASIVSGWFYRRKTAAEVHALYSQALNQAAQGYAALASQQNETARKMAEMLTRLTTAEDEIRSLRNENATLRAEIARLRGLLLRSGVDPYSGKRVTDES